MGCMFRYIERFILKELAHVIVRLASLKSVRQARRLESQGRVNDEAKISLEAEYLSSWGSQSFFLRSLTTCMRPIHILKVNLLYSKCFD